MARPSNPNPTPAEIELLNIIWNQGPCSAQNILDALISDGKESTYPAVISLLAVMYSKGFLTRWREGRKHVYQAKVAQRHVLRKIIDDLVKTAFNGTPALLVQHLFDDQPSESEIAAMKRLIREYEQK